MGVCETKESSIESRIGRAEVVPELTIFIPVYNEVESLLPLHEKIERALSTLHRKAEIIYVDDGSSDRTLEILRRIARRDSRVCVISFHRNYGKTAAMAAGIEHTRGRILISMDADGQNDPSDIESLLIKLEEGYDIVSGWRRKRQDTLKRILPSKIANRVVSIVSGVPLHDCGCCLKAYRRETLAGLKLYGEMHRFVPIYCAYLNGARIAELPIQHHPRIGGVSKYGKLSRTFEVMLDLITIRFMDNYRTKPMHFIGSLGLVTFAVAVCALLAALSALAIGSTLFAATMFVLFAIGIVSGLLFIVLGLLSEILMRTYYESQAKPIYTVRETIGFGSSTTSKPEVE